MAWDIETVRNAIDETESSRRVLVSAMNAYEKAWRLDYWSDKDYEEARANGWKLYTSPEPRNVVSLTQSLINGRLRVICPTYESDGDSGVNARVRAKFLEMLIARQSHMRDTNLIDELTWYGAVLGRVVIQVAWIWNQLSEDQKKFMPPILYRALDPRNCGFHRDAYGLQWAYHKYKENIETAKRGKYASFFKDKTQEGIVPPQDPKKSQTVEVEFTDFWYMDKGQVYNAVLIDNEFAAKPRKSQFPKIPLFERANDPAPSSSERWRSGSVLEGMLGTWGEMNYLHSMQITAVTKKFFPAMFFTNDEGRQMPPLDLGPDAVNDLPPGIRPLPRPDDRPDIALLTSTSDQFAAYLQKSTYPDVLYGDAGTQRAAYGAHMMMSSAARRAQPLRNQLEVILEEANELALFMVKKFSPDEIELYGYNPATHEGEQVKIGSEAVGDRFDNKVTIDMIVPGSDTQKMMNLLQYNQQGLLSNDTTRRLGLPADLYVPDNEGMLILMEKIASDPDIEKDMMRQAYKVFTGRDLPAGEPDGERTPPPMPQGPMQGANISPMAGSPEFQGMSNPEMMGMQPGMDTSMQMAMMNGGMPSPNDMSQMAAGTYRRR